ncbi:hypothetical protein DAPPUDRAFT_109603 [Daphnia pulex]|uniref:Potassium channel domain-containing protein n=1 Tax=Daphnia pulex TaxID=6669 RepID=E9H3K7_DAPPU|nr:hypothetical protein DAPPUDRAFT_109603 [Daphnia pulex]|eukprot:EFX73530.1 hypothetical protein DAPPUDRAFT_109603 [Daphnia pulex]
MGSSRLRQSSLEERYRKCLRISLTFLFSQVGLIGLVVAYSAVGAVLFEWLEADQEIEPRRKILQIRLDCLDDLNRLNRQRQFDNNSNDELWAINAGALLKAFETQVVKATKVEGYDGKEVDDAERQWSVSGSLLYSITVITTIGYGNLAPKTGPGKVVTIIYALIGKTKHFHCAIVRSDIVCAVYQSAQHQPTPFSAAFSNIVPCEPHTSLEI